MDQWGTMTPAARVEWLGNALVELAKIPDTLADEQDTEQHDQLAGVVSEIAGLLDAMDKWLDGCEDSMRHLRHEIIEIKTAVGELQQKQETSKSKK